MKFYAFEYASGRNTTSGQPNDKTGHLNRAGFLAVFTSRSDRDAWVESGKSTADMGGNCRESVTSSQARKLHLGMSVADYKDMVEMSLDQTLDL